MISHLIASAIISQSAQSAPNPPTVFRSTEQRSQATVRVLKRQNAPLQQRFQQVITDVPVETVPSDAWLSVRVPRVSITLPRLRLSRQPKQVETMEEFLVQESVPQAPQFGPEPRLQAPRKAFPESPSKSLSVPSSSLPDDESIRRIAKLESDIEQLKTSEDVRLKQLLKMSYQLDAIQKKLDAKPSQGPSIPPPPESPSRAPSKNSDPEEGPDA